MTAIPLSGYVLVQQIIQKLRWSAKQIYKLQKDLSQLQEYLVSKGELLA